MAMSSKLKKWIIAGVGFLVVGIIVLVAITFLSGISTTTVYNLRFVEAVVVEPDEDEPIEGEDPEVDPNNPSQSNPSNPGTGSGTGSGSGSSSSGTGTRPGSGSGSSSGSGSTGSGSGSGTGTRPGSGSGSSSEGDEEEEEPEIEYEYVEVFEKEVFLIAGVANQFDVSVQYAADGRVDFTVTSSNPSVATIAENEDGGYTVTYFKAGVATLRVFPTDNPDIFDSFVLYVRENAPVSFKIIEDEEVNKNVNNSSSVYVYADEKEYSFKFDATNGGDLTNVNLSGIYVIADYDKQVFNDIHIDDMNSALVICAKQSELYTRELITLQSRQGGEDGELIKSFMIEVEVRGNYLINIQLCIDYFSDFDKITYIYGKGALLEDEISISRIILAGDVNLFYFKIRVVYTNGDVDYVTSRATPFISNSSGMRPDLTLVGDEYGGYYILMFDTSLVPAAQNSVATMSFYAENLSDVLNIEYYPSMEADVFKEFADKELYKKVYDTETGEFISYEYVYWDIRFMRDDQIVVDGKIIGFVNGNPSCGEVESTDPSGVSDEDASGGDDDADAEGRDEGGSSHDEASGDA